MVSKRKFFSIATMMFVLFFLFQFSMVLRDSKNTYDINSSLTEKRPMVETGGRLLTATVPQ